MIEVTRLHRAYGSFVAVDDISFAIGKGEIVGLLGHNGAGKTTIMKMLSGYLEPDSGQIRIDGLRLDEQPQAVKSRIGYLPENLPVYPELRVAEYLEYAAGVKGIPAERRREAIRRAVAATDLTARLLAPIGTLSRGQKQRVGVAQAILGRPRVLILDEPTNGLDPRQTRQMRALIREVARDATVILSTHIMQEVEALCDRVLILRDGRLVVDESLEALQRSDTLLLETDLTAAALQPHLQGLGQMREESACGTHQRYQIRLLPGAALEPTLATLSRRLIEAGAALYRIQPCTRDLETLFRAASEEEVNDAA